ncbi:hypothetical protein [Altererythrobacter sp.]|uniref:hypothetical protein n=1 Tax=Altererythrobacter sp. TaxID=1872480 RepID=UPI003D049173
MSWDEQLRQTFEQVRKSRSRLKDLARSSTEGWQTDYGRARQELSSSLSDLESTARTVAEASSDELFKECHEAVANFQRKLENHQARWPVLIIKDRNDDYRKSMDEVDASFAELAQKMDRI